MTSTVQRPDEEATWLLSVASPNEKALALHTKAAVKDAAQEAVGRCTKIIKDTDAGIYRRGMAVLALGRTLAREMGRPPQMAGNRDSFAEVVRKVIVFGGA